MRTILLLLVAACAFAVDHTNGIRVTIGIDSGGGSTQNIYLDQQSGSNWIVGNDGNLPAPCRYLFGSGVNISAADGSGNRTISVSPTTFTGSSPSRSLNTGWQLTSALTNGIYAIKIATTLTISGGSEGEVYAEQADDSGFSTNLVQLGVISNGNSGTLVVGVSLAQPSTFQLCTGPVPSGKWLRLRTNNVSGTPTYTLRLVREY